MTKLITFLVTILLLMLIIFIHDEALAINRIFLLDTSGSMKKEGLFDRIKETVKRDYVLKMKQGDHIIILTFDEKVVMVVDQNITGENDIKEVNTQIDGLNATGSWTWMARALQMAMEQAKRLKAQYPEEGLNIYFLTDGINDPPPNLNEPRLKFIEVLLQYFKDLKMEDAYVYVLVYKEEREPPPVTRENQEELEKETKGMVKIDTRSRTLPNPIPPEIRIGYSGFDFGIVNLAKGEVAKTGTIRIKELKGDARGKIIKLLSETDLFPELISFEVTPDSFEIQKEGQIEKISILIPQNLSSGEYIPSLKISSDDVLISPNTIPVSFKAVRIDDTDRSDSDPYDWTWMWRILLAILILIVLYLLLLILRIKNLWAQREDQESRHPIRVKNMKKDSLESVGLSNYQVGFGVYPQEAFSVFLFKGGKKERKVIIGESIKRQDPQGKDIIITFHEKSSITQPEGPIPETEKKEEDPDFFKKKDDKIIDFLSDEHKGDIK